MHDTKQSKRYYDKINLFLLRFFLKIIQKEKNKANNWFNGEKKSWSSLPLTSICISVISLNTFDVSPCSIKFTYFIFTNLCCYFCPNLSKPFCGLFTYWTHFCCWTVNYMYITKHMLCNVFCLKYIVFNFDLQLLIQFIFCIKKNNRVTKYRSNRYGWPVLFV